MAVTPVLLAPGQEAVFPLPPAFVAPQDGHPKQDCELAASARWLPQWAPRIAPWGVTFLGDDLYCHQPFCQQALAQGATFCSSACPNPIPPSTSGWPTSSATPRSRPGRHPLDGHPTPHRYLSVLPSFAVARQRRCPFVDWCELTTTDATGRVIYRNAWATSHTVTAETVVAMVAAGRSRWKIENENNNTLKTKGYHFEHNYGHGKQHLSAVLATLILLAYLVHTVLDRLDQRYRAVRAQLPSRHTFFEHLRALAQYLPFDSWDHLFDFMLDGLGPAPRKAKGRPNTG